MVFVNLDRKAPAAAPARKGGKAAPEKRCMTCGNTLDSEASGIDARRFCSTQCKEAYMTGL